MHSDEQIRDLLFDYVDDLLDLETRRIVSERLNASVDLQADYAHILDMQKDAQVWQEIPAPQWNPPRIVSTMSWSWGNLNLLQWFPTAASATALLLVVALYFRAPDEVTPTVTPTAAIPTVPQYLQQASFDDPVETAFAQSLLETGRQQRQEELTTLMKVLTAEMNKRSLETEESLRYIISYQIQEQQDFDELYEQVQDIANTEPGSDDNPGDTL
jgi:hypothetical protein